MVQEECYDVPISGIAKMLFKAECRWRDYYDKLIITYGWNPEQIRIGLGCQAEIVFQTWQSFQIL